MGDMLKVTYAGQLAGDPTMEYTTQGTPVTNFSVAYNNKYNGKEETTWLRCTVWGKKAENVNTWCKKGTKVHFVGNLIIDKDTGGPRIWYDKEGNPRAGFEVNVYEITFISDLNDGGSKEDSFPYPDAQGDYDTPVSGASALD